LLLVAVLATAGCGKRGNPLPPLRPVPAAIADFKATRTDARVELSFTVPSANVDGTTPVAIDRVEIYAVPVATGATTKTVAQMLADNTALRATIAVRPPSVDAPASSSSTAATPMPATPARAAEVDRRQPGPGEHASVVDDLGTLANGAASVNYVAVGVVGGGRGRKGPASPLVSVSLAEAPAAPVELTVTHDERTVTVTWPRVTGQQVLLYDATPAGASAAPAPPAPTPEPVPVAANGASSSPRQLTPSPVTSFTFSEPVQFGVERCFTARSVRVTGGATVQGPESSVACITPVDRYPPAAPTSLQAIQEGAAVTLNWARVEASDVAGYVVLRGDGAGENMRPLVRQPIADTTFSDTDVVAGQTYTYTVYAVDTAPIPNVSQQSARQSITVR
jgi:hypothetical protein